MRQARRHPTIARPRRGPGDKASEQAARLASTTGTSPKGSNWKSPPGRGMALLYEHYQHEQLDQQGQRQRDGRDRRGCPPARRSAPAAPQPARRSSPRRTSQKEGSVQNGILALAGAFVAAHSRASRMNTAAGVIRLTTARASCPAAAASQPGIRRTRIARPQAARFTVWPRPGALPGPGGGQQHAEHLLPVERAVGGRVAAQQARVASFQDCCPGRVPGGHVPSRPGGLAGSARAHAVPPASRALSRCAATAALARRRSVSAPSSVAPSSVSR